jgi:hypothetical protein
LGNSFAWKKRPARACRAYPDSVALTCKTAQLRFMPRGVVYLLARRSENAVKLTQVTQLPGLRKGAEEPGDEFAKPRRLQWHQGHTTQISRGEIKAKIRKWYSPECLLLLHVVVTSDHNLLSEASAFLRRQGEGEDPSQRSLHLLLQVQH